MKKRAIGIDLGTTYSCVGVWMNGEVQIIPNISGDRTTPSYVSFEDGKDYVGEAAKNIAGNNLQNTIFDSKRLIGRKINDREVQIDLKYWPFIIESKDDGRPYYKIVKNQNEISKRTLEYFPEEISGLILKYMKKIAEDFLGEKVIDAVVTVPAYFNDTQREATKQAAKMAGLNILRIINEPTAAAIAYGINNKKKNKENALVFDFGGGTFDVTILTLENDFIIVKAHGGDNHLGGNNIDERLVKYCLDEFKSKFNVDISKEKNCVHRLRKACERAKIDLSHEVTTTIDIDSLWKGKDFFLTLTRAKFEDLCKNIFSKLIDKVKEVLEDSNFQKNNINEILLVGGSSRIPKVQSDLEQCFNKKPNNSLNPDEVVAIGASIHAANINKISGEKIPDIRLMDVTPFSLGIKEGINDDFSVVIPRGSGIPIQFTRKYQTLYDNQTIANIDIFEGEYEKAEDNHKLGSFDLCDLPKMPKGECKIDVIFDIDVNSILKVKAVETTEKKTNEIIIKYEKGILTPEELQNALKKNNEFEKRNFNNMGKLAELGNQLSQKMKEYDNMMNSLSLNKEKFKYCIEFSQFIKEYLDQIDIKLLVHEWLKDKYIYYICVLFICYSKALSLNSQREEDKYFIDSIQNNVQFYFDVVKEFNVGALRGMAEIFINQTHFFHYLLLKIMRIYANSGFLLLEKTKPQYAKNKFKESLKFAEENKLDQLNFEDELKEDYDDIVESCKFNIKRITAQSLIDEAENHLKNAVENSENINIFLVNLALDQYKNAYKIISRDYNNISQNKHKNYEKSTILESNFNLFYDLSNSSNYSYKGTYLNTNSQDFDEISDDGFKESNENSCIDIEYEAICLSNIVKIKYELLKSTDLEKLLNDANKSIQLGESLFPKNVSNESWFIKIRNLKVKIQMDYDKLNEKESNENIDKVKKDCQSIIDEIEENSKKTNIEFITFILSKYPYEGFQIIHDLENQIRNNLVNFLTDLKKHYNEQNFNSKSTNENELKKFIIAEKISKHLNEIVLCFSKQQKVRLKKKEKEKVYEDEY